MGLLGFSPIKNTSDQRCQHVSIFISFGRVNGEEEGVGEKQNAKVCMMGFCTINIPWIIGLWHYFDVNIICVNMICVPLEYWRLALLIYLGTFLLK